ncbi:hypothetical protein IV54_GL000461 [Levilactobacillus paucivorans]|uniref:N-acetyltransferase domain-containing protein n=1 Tax=Levilactobacillus paucivorans TaxID=616990 RepID=A0A0R2LQ56_9LACO|nr:hypothetical protein [Levilactobacillus paucivorans]KRO01245.1 hypothetical protein IV54_GL000461 [Levilactobacillus paucivorans]
MLRAATIVDADAVAILVLHELERRHLRRLRRLTKEQLSQLLFVGYHQENFRYGYRQARVYQNQGVAVGVAYGYPAAVEPTLDNQWAALFERLQVAPSQQLVVTPRALPDEWYLDLLTVRPRSANKTYQQWWFDEWLMADALRQARQSGARVVGMDVRPGSRNAQLAAEFGFLVSAYRQLDRQPYVHLRYRLN